MAKVFTIKKRKEFLRVASKGFKVVMPTTILQAAQNFCAENKPADIGFTATKKLGKAFVRNRTKRRMRAVVRELISQFSPNTSYVLIGRHNTATCDFQLLKKDISQAIKTINSQLKAKQNENPANCSN